MQCLEPVFVQTFIAEPAIEVLDVAVVHRPPRLDQDVAHAEGLRPGDERPAGELRPVVGSHHCRVSDNLLNRDFNADAPNEQWLTDIKEFQIPAGKVYLSPTIDCVDGMVVSWSIGTRPNAELVNTMLDAAVGKVAVSGERPEVHSDRGGHYRWPGWLARIADAKLACFMSRKGCSPDNAACEGFISRLKIEMFFSRD